MQDYYSLLRAFKQALAEQTSTLKTVPFGHLVHLKEFANTTKGPSTSMMWKVLYGMVKHVTGTTTEVYVTANDGSYTPLQIMVVLAATTSRNLNFFRNKSLSDAEEDICSSYQQVLLDDTLMIRHIGAATGFCSMVVWEWEASKIFRL